MAQIMARAVSKQYRLLLPRLLNLPTGITHLGSPVGDSGGVADRGGAADVGGAAEGAGGVGRGAGDGGQDDRPPEDARRQRHAQTRGQSLYSLSMRKFEILLILLKF